MKYLLALLLLWATVATIGGECYRRQRQDFEARAHHAETVNAHLRQLASADAEDARFHEREALRAQRQALVLRDSLSRVVAQLDSTADTVFTEAPAGCGAVVELAHRYREAYGKQEIVIAGLVETIHQDSLALDKRTHEASLLRQANDSLLGALRSRPRPHKWLGLLPKPAFVVGYGATISGGSIRVGPALTVGIRVSF